MRCTECGEETDPRHGSSICEPCALAKEGDHSHACAVCTQRSTDACGECEHKYN